jgi:hypothetical protein
MEASPVKPTHNEESPAVDKKETRKSKKKNAENLGTFIVEAKPESEKDNKDSSDKGESFWGRFGSDDKEKIELPDDNTAETETSNDLAPELDGEAPLEHLSRVEAEAVIQNIARIRAEEIGEERNDLEPGSIAELQARAAEAFMAMAAVTGDVELARESIGSTYDDEDLPAEPTEGATTERPSENSDVESMPAEDDDPLLAGGAGGSGTPPEPPTGGGAFYRMSPSGAETPGPIGPSDVVHESSHAASGALVGGIVGYLAGRREGRVKTEKKLMPVQQKLEKEVRSLQQQLMTTEFAIRDAVAKKEQARQSPGTQESSRRRPAERPIAAEIARAVPKVPAERLGHVIITAEAVPVKSTQRVEALSPENAASIEKNVMAMSRRELFDISDKIIIDGASLRQVYETHLIGERGLRRLVTEYLRGGNVKKKLRRELIEREIDFERDPILRDRARSSVSGGGKSAVNSLIHEAAAVALPDDASKDGTQQVKVQQQKQADAVKPDNPHHIADVSLVTLIAVLLALVIIVSVSHH